MSEAEERLAAVRARIEAAAERADRDPSDVTLVAVSKTFPASRITDLLAAGHRHFGENRAQELESKVREVPGDVEWHFVGHLQSNKARVVTGVSLIHSIDSLKTAEAVSRRAVRLEVEQRVLIEVNTSGEPSKGGVRPADAVELAGDVDGLPCVAVAGRMTIPALPDDPEDSRPTYKEMLDLSRDLRETLPDAAELSMGMSRDFEVAIEEGATLVRVGEALFGPRSPAPG